MRHAGTRWNEIANLIEQNPAFWYQLDWIQRTPINGQPENGKPTQKFWQGVLVLLAAVAAQGILFRAAGGVADVVSVSGQFHVPVRGHAVIVPLDGECLFHGQSPLGSPYFTKSNDRPFKVDGR